MKNEVKFLREQVATSNKIIEILSTDRVGSNVRSNEVNKTNVPLINVSTDKCNLEESKNVIGEKDESKKDPIHMDVTKKKRKKRNISVIGDIEGYKMRNGMKDYEKVYVKSFSGATISCMQDYIKPTLKHNPDVILIHVGTNDLRSSKSAQDIANEIINLSTTIKSEENEVIISNIILRNDSLNNKGIQVNSILK